MKKLYLISALASLYLAPTAIAQNTEVLVDDPIMQTISLETERHNVDVDYNTVSNREYVFCSDFSDSSEWIVETNGQGTWEWVTETPPEISLYAGEMASQTADNGFGLFNGIQWLLDPPVLAQESTLTLNSSVDCTTVDNVIVCFNQRYKAYNVDQTFLDVSIDGGQTWEVYQLNAEVETNEPTIQGEIAINISGIAAGQSDVKIRFRWRSDYLGDNPEATEEEINSFGSGYFWMVDDLCVSTPPENEITIGTAWYQNFFEIQEQEDYTDVELINASEYHTVPYHSLRPFNFACVVHNKGILDQTNVQLIVTITDSDGNIGTMPNGNPIESELGFTLAAGAIDTLKIYDVMPSNWTESNIGAFSIDFEVVQDEVDELPANNIGTTRYTRISDDAYTGPFNGGGSVIMHSNANTIVPNATETNLEDDVIHGNRYTFDESDTDYYIVAIEFALQSETEDNEQILLNLRTGSVLEEEGPENVMDLFFSYDDEELPYITDESMFTDDSNPVWISYELPFGILIEPNTIYQPEIMLPASGSPYCMVGATTGRQRSAGVFYYFPEPSSGPQGWNEWTTLEYNLRLVTSYTLGIDNLTIENGIKLMQNYPNPFNDVTRIQYQFDKTSAATLEVYDMSGKLVFADDLGIISRLTANSYMFNKGSLASGMYTYSIVTENNRVTRKMTIE